MGKPVIIGTGVAVKPRAKMVGVDAGRCRHLRHGRRLCVVFFHSLGTIGYSIVLALDRLPGDGDLTGSAVQVVRLVNAAPLLFRCRRTGDGDPIKAFGRRRRS